MWLHTYFFTSDVSFSRVAVNASAGHGPSWEGIIDPALSICCTGLDFQTGISTVSAKAGKFAGTINISLATRIWWWWYWSGK